MATAYHSRELSYLQNAQSDLKLAEICQTTATATDAKKLNTNYVRCAAIASDALLKFERTWDNQTNTFANRKKFTDAIRMVFGDVEEGSKSFRRLGVIPFLIVTGILAGIGVITYKFIQRWKKASPGDATKDIPIPLPPNDGQIFVIRVLALFVVMLVLLPISWTYGMSARYEGARLGASLHHDSSEGMNDSFKVYNNKEFAKIWLACKTVSLHQIYNCTQGLTPNVGLDEVESIKGAVCTPGGAPDKVFDDTVTLKNGLEALVNINLSDLDKVGILQSINRDITKLRSLLAPQTSTTSKMSMAELQGVVVKRIIPCMQKPTYIPTDASTYVATHALLLVDKESIITEIASILLIYWPQLKPAAYMQTIDESMVAYYDRAYYSQYFRPYVVSFIQEAMNRVAFQLKVGDPRFASPFKFGKENWSIVSTTLPATKTLVADLFTNICRFTDTFVPNNQVGKNMGAELMVMYVNCALGCITLGGAIYLIYLIGISEKSKSSEAIKWDLGNTAWYARMDLVKYVLIVIAVAMFSMSILVVIRNKTQAKALHNSNALYYNSQRLKGAAWNLLNTIYPLTCTPDAIALLKTTDPKAHDACVKGNAFPAVSAPPTSAVSSMFYTNAVNVILAYERCNLVTQTNKVPFPTAEFIITGVFMIICIFGLVFLTSMTMPLQKIKDIRDYLRLRDRLTMLTTTIPASLSDTLKLKLSCSDTGGVDVLRILSFSFIVILFILNAVLVMSFNQSASNFQSALNSMSSDVCI